MKIKLVILSLLLFCLDHVNAQVSDSLMQEIKFMSKETDPEKTSVMMRTIIDRYHLKEPKNAEVIDMLKGIVAMNYVKAGNYQEFDKLVASMNNKFNQTSYLNMAASTLLSDSSRLKAAESYAKRALDLYFKIKDNPKEKPASYAQADWDRFMKFAYYPYHDTYAHVLFEQGRYKEALAVQEKAFEDSPENGMPPSVERYARLLVLNDQPEKAYELVLEMAKTGRSTAGMNKLLKDLYVEKYGAADYDEFYADLQKNVVAALKEKLKSKMQTSAAPAFTLKDLDGNTVSLSDFSGKVVVLDFWATWCVPCKASFPAMKKVVEKHPEVKFLFIATQEKQEGAIERVRNYIVQNSFPFHVLMDKPDAEKAQRFQVMSEYEVEGIPTKFVIDPNGIQRFSSVGFTSDTELINEMEAMIQLAAENS